MNLDNWENDTNYLEFIMTLDKRSLSKVLSAWKMKANINIIFVAMVYCLISVLVCITLQYISVNTTEPLAFYGIFVLVKMVLNFNTLVAAHIRASFFGKITLCVRTIISFHSPFNYREFLRKHVYESIVKENERAIIEFNKGLNITDKKLPSWRNYQIHQYWEVLGLDRKKIMRDAINVRVKADKPERENTTKIPCFDTRNYCGSQIILHEYAREWEPSNMTDIMHVKSLIKRVIGKREIYDIKSQITFKVKMLELLVDMPLHDISTEEAVFRALSTKGTAGQFSKRSDIEKIWKDKNSQQSIEIWLSISNTIHVLTMLTNWMPQEVVQYMLYRKMEPLPVENGEVKITRVMNAPNLLARVADSRPFIPFNDALVDIRFDKPPKVGMNILLELKMVLIHNPSMNVLTMDYQDYDGGQTASQMLACCLARVHYMYKNNQCVEDLCYMMPRYLRHVCRNVKSTYGIEYDTIGQQASGDITTTDDNTIKSYTQAEIYDDKIRKHLISMGKIKEEKRYHCYNSSMGDDTVKIFPNNIIDEVTLANIINETAKQIGWTIKPGSLSILPAKQNGSNFFLSHSVSERQFSTANTNVVLTFAVVVKERNRMSGKWSIAAEMSDELSMENTASLSSKYLTAIMVGLGNPEVIMPSVYMLIFLRSKMADYNQSYMLNNVQASTIRVLLLNNLIKLQTGVIFMLTRFEMILVTDDEEKLIIKQIEMTNNLLTRYMENGMINKESSSYFKIDIINNWWNYNNVIKHLNYIMNMLSTSSHARGKQNHIKWWVKENELVSIEEIHPNAKTVISCNHVEAKNVYRTTDFKCKFHCLECWSTRVEQPYQSINLALVRASQVV